MSMRESEPTLLEDRLMGLALEGKKMFADCVLDEGEADRLFAMFNYELPRLVLHVSEIRLSARIRARVDRCGPHRPIDRHIQQELDDLRRRLQEIERRANEKRPRASEVAEVKVA